MQPGFWKNLKKPILALAPMANVTDAAFRRIIAKYGRPDVMFTEFVSVEGLIATGALNASRRAESPLIIDLMYGDSERPIVAQIFGGKPEQFYKVAQLIKKLGFDGIDINMGCPDSGVEKSGGGAALIKNPKLAQEIIRATQEGAPDLPVSVKTRLGYNKNEIETWLPMLLETKLAAITIHLRTRKEMSKVPAHWEKMARVMQIAKSQEQRGQQTLILGNGDIENLAQANECVKKYDCDGVMIGRGIFGNPFLFTEQKRPANLSARKLALQAGGAGHPTVSYRSDTSYSTYIPTIEEKLQVCLEHTKLFVELYKGEKENGKWLKNFDIMKKHYKAYINGFSGAKELRGKLMEAETVAEVEELISGFLTKNF